MNHSVLWRYPEGFSFKIRKKWVPGTMPLTLSSLWISEKLPHHNNDWFYHGSSLRNSAKDIKLLLSAISFLESYIYKQTRVCCHGFPYQPTTNESYSDEPISWKTRIESQTTQKLEGKYLVDKLKILAIFTEIKFTVICKIRHATCLPSLYWPITINEPTFQ